MKKISKYGRNPKLNQKTNCVMARFDDVKWQSPSRCTRNRRCTRKPSFSRLISSDRSSRCWRWTRRYWNTAPSCPTSMPSSVPSTPTTTKSWRNYAAISRRGKRWHCYICWRSVPSTLWSWAGILWNFRGECTLNGNNGRNIQIGET